jgi:molecular chaperone GrpE (heat shock protein)
MTIKNKQSDAESISPSITQGGENQDRGTDDSTKPVSNDAMDPEPLDFNASDHFKIKPFKPKLEYSDETKALVKEIAEDLVHFMEQMKTMETQQNYLVSYIERLHKTIQESDRRHAAALENLRQELLGERKVLATRNSFNAILPTLDSLELMRDGIPDSPENAQIRAQLQAVNSSLTNIIQTLGFIEYDVELGSTFDPSLMECMGYVEGEENSVVKVKRKGHKVGDIIIRPCGVILAKPSGNNQNKGDSNE